MKKYLVSYLFFVALIFVGCAGQKAERIGQYDFIGKWNLQPETLTYVNYDQHIKLTFPNKKWRVYTRPHKDLVWNKPTKNDPSHDILMAKTPSLHMALTILPNPEEMSLDEFAAIQKVRMRWETKSEKLEKELKAELKKHVVDVDIEALGFEFLESKFVHRPHNARTIWVTIFKMEIDGLNMKIRQNTFEDTGRFIMVQFACLEELCGSKEDESWAIVDSCECIE